MPDLDARTSASIPYRSDSRLPTLSSQTLKPLLNLLASSDLKAIISGDNAEPDSTLCRTNVDFLNAPSASKPRTPNHAVMRQISRSLLTQGYDLAAGRGPSSSSTWWPRACGSQASTE